MKQEIAGSGQQGVPSTDVEYTCPMHPEIVRAQPGRCPKCNMNLERKGGPEPRPK